MLVGLTLGVLIGVLPGLGGANGVAILLPLSGPRAELGAAMLKAAQIVQRIGTYRPPARVSDTWRRFV